MSDKIQDIPPTRAKGIPSEFSGVLDCLTAARSYGDEAEKHAAYATDADIALVKSHLALGAYIHALVLALIIEPPALVTTAPDEGVSQERLRAAMRQGGLI